jgi:hypothetical protein
MRELRSPLVRRMESDKERDESTADENWFYSLAPLPPPSLSVPAAEDGAKSMVPCLHYMDVIHQDWYWQDGDEGQSEDEV